MMCKYSEARTRQISFGFALTLLVSMSSCSIMPYNDKFACEGEAEYGKCTSVSGAYHEAVTGESAGRSIKQGDNRDDDSQTNTSSEVGDGGIWETGDDGLADVETGQSNEINELNEIADQNVNSQSNSSPHSNFNTSQSIALSEKEFRKIKKTVEARSHLQYKTQVYEKLTKLIDQPLRAPMVKQPTQIRTLILSYTTHKEHKPLYMPRYVYYMLDDYMWVLGDYLSETKSGNFDSLYDTGE